MSIFTLPELMSNIYTVRTSTGYGSLSMLTAYCDWCREFVGEDNIMWKHEIYIWEYEFMFIREADALMFQLKWDCNAARPKAKVLAWPETVGQYGR